MEIVIILKYLKKMTKINFKGTSIFLWQM